MPFSFFHDLFPAMAEAETRSISVFGDDSETGLPDGHYAFYEMFCDEPGCDCRRVIFYVVSSFRQDPVAVVAWGWEKPEFYARWLHNPDPETVAELIGPILNYFSPQTDLSEPILDLVRDVLLQDSAYVERVKRHYRLFRRKIDANANAGVRKASRKPKKKKKKRKNK